MSLHARNIAVAAGVPEKLVDAVAERMVKEGKVRMDRAKELIKEIGLTEK
jgi:hydroxymethylglutaryl-CoA reductase